MTAFYRQFRLCITTAHLGDRKGIGLSPYPYQFYYRKKVFYGRK